MASKSRFFAFALVLFTSTVITRAQQAPAPAAPAPPRFQNLQVLPKDIPLEELKTIMKSQAQALGVDCAFCHVRGNAASDDKKEKVTARSMMKMVKELNGSYFKDQKVKLQCWTCHRGHEEPQVAPPAAPAPR